MFDTMNDRVIVLRPHMHEGEIEPNPDTLKQHCLDPASLWVLKRRANLPHRGPQRLPAVARVG